jgi:hypothetical protein
VIRKPLAAAQLQGENALAGDDARHSEAISLDNPGRAFAWPLSFDVATQDYRSTVIFATLMSSAAAQVSAKFR